MSHYPHAPGYKESSTSKDSAAKIKPHAKDVRGTVLFYYQMHDVLKAWFTADEVASGLGLSILTVRPRVTELYKQGKLVDTGHRRRNASGHWAKVWRLATKQEQGKLEL